MKKQDESAAGQHASLPVLVIEDDPTLREQVATLLESGGYPVVWGDSKTDILKWLSWRVLGIVSGIRTVEGVDLHEWLAQHLPQLTQRVVLVGTAPQVGPAEWDFVPTLFHPDELLSAVGKAMGKPEATERILMVDDEEPIREILANMLGFAGYRCCTFAGGGQALKLLDSGEKFDLVTSDLLNSPLDGIGFLEQMKDKFPEIPFLVISAVQ